MLKKTLINPWAGILWTTFGVFFYVNPDSNDFYFPGSESKAQQNQNALVSGMQTLQEYKTDKYLVVLYWCEINQVML